MANIKVNYDRPDLKPEECLSRALTVFSYRVKNEGVLENYKERMYYEKPTTKRCKARKRKVFLSKLNFDKWK